MQKFSEKNIQEPSVQINNLHCRAEVLTKIRNFFAARKVMEVETPLLCTTTATDPYIGSIKVGADRYLQTSPEFPMKRLLAAGSGSIYQISKAFRNDEMGRLHNPEFTMLEWYRLDFNHHQLINEIDELLQLTLNCGPAEKYFYQEIFEKYLQINPHTIDIHELKNCAKKNGIHATALDADNPDTWLQILLTHRIEPELGKNVPVFIYDFPSTQAALARVRNDNPPVAERFEVYYRGIELANGYHELADAKEQQRRFLADQKKRQQLGYESVPVDEKLIAALAQGFPNCAGAALGIDRLVMLAAKANSIAEVMSFVWNEV